LIFRESLDKVTDTLFRAHRETALKRFYL